MSASEVEADRIGSSWRVVTVVLAAPIAVLSGMQLILPALPVIQRDLGLSEAEISLVSTAYLLPGVLMAIPAGLLGDRVGRRLLFGWSLILFGATGLALFFVHDFQLLLLGRLIQGVAFAAILPLTITMIGELWGSDAQLRNQGLRVVGMNAANVLWPLIGGAVAVSAWHSIFLFQAMAAPLGIAALFVLPDDARSFKRQKDGERVRLLPMMGSSRALAVETTAFLRFLARFGFLTYAPILLVTRQGFSPFQAGITIGGAALLATASAGVTGRLARRVPPSRLLAATALGMGCGLVMLSVGGVGSWIGPLVYGLADGVFAVVHSGFMTSAVPQRVRATFVATTGAIKNFGKFLGPSVVVALLLLVELEIAFVVLAAITAAMAPLARLLRDLDHGLAPPRGRLPAD